MGIHSVLKIVESLSPVFTLWWLCDLFFGQWNSSKYDKLRNLESVWALKFTLSMVFLTFQLPCKESLAIPPDNKGHLVQPLQFAKGLSSTSRVTSSSQIMELLANPASCISCQQRTASLAQSRRLLRQPTELAKHMITVLSHWYFG